jgi:hypothetical protein
MTLLLVPMPLLGGTCHICLESKAQTLAESTDPVQRRVAGRPRSPRM